MTLKTRLLLLLVFLIGKQINAQCDTNNFVVTQVNGTCLQDAIISVQITGALTCSGWNAILTKPGNIENTLAIPANGGPVDFTGLPAGNYNVRLFNGISTVQWGTTVVLTTTYTNMVLAVTSTVSSCPSNAPSYVPDATLTINKTSGGIGPFVYEVTTSLGTQTFGPTTNISHTFNGIPDGETVAFTVTDQAGGMPGCQTTQTQTPKVIKNGRIRPPVSIRSNHIRMDSPNCNSYRTLFTVWHSGSAKDIAPGVFTLNVTSGPNSGLVQVLPITAPFHSYGYYYDSPNLQVGDKYTVTYTTSCWNTITKTDSVVAPDDNFLSIINTSSRLIDTLNNCTNNYQLRISSAGSKYDYFCDSTTVTILQEQPALSGIYVQINQLYKINITQDWKSSFSSVASFNTSINIPSDGNYRLIADDGCHSVTKDISIPVISNPFSTGTGVSKGVSILAGTGGVRVATNIQGGANSPVSISINPTPSVTSLSYYAPGPLGLAGNYTVNFPFVRQVTGTTTFSDLPPGDYNVSWSNSCGDTRSENYTILPVDTVSYSPSFSVEVGCNNSNTIRFDMNESNTSNYAFVDLYTNDGIGGLGVFVQGISANPYGYSGRFLNVPAGDYIIRFRQLGAHYAGVSVVTVDLASNREYLVPISVSPYQDITLSTQTIICTDSTGVITADISSGTPLYPLIYNLYDTAGTLIQSDTAQDSTSLIGVNIIYNDMDTGDYVISVISGYSALTPNGCYSLNRNLTISSSQTTPYIIAADTIVCISNNTTTLGIPLDTVYWKITWYDIIGNVLDTNVNTIQVSPVITNQYIINYQLKSNIGCLTPPVLTDTIIITVVNEPDTITKNVIGDTVCKGISAFLAVLAADSGTIYEVYQNNDTLTSRIIDTAFVNGDVVFTIPDSILVVGLNTFQIKAANYFCAGGVLDSSGYILVGDVISPVAICANVTIQLDQNGVASITPQDLDGGTTDNCGVASLNVSKINFDCNDKGANSVWFIATDSAGNIDSCTAIVTVVDIDAPTIICLNDQTDTVISATCDYIIQDYTSLLINSSDNCTDSSKLIYTQTPPAGTNIDINSGEAHETINISVSDSSGITTSCSFDLGLFCINELIIPQFISPNGDGKNDVWYIENIEYFSNNTTKIFNRYGALVYSKYQYDNTFNGTSNTIKTQINLKGDGLLPAGTYFYIIDIESQESNVYTGYLEIIY